MPVGWPAVRPDDLAALVVGEAVERAGVDPELVDEVVLGAANQAGEDNRNVARMATLLAGLPQSVPGFTVNRLCASGLTAVATARQMVASGDADLVVAGGVESMTRAPWVMEKPAKAFARPGATLRHLDRVAVHQPPLRRRHDAVDAADRRTGGRALGTHPRGARRLRAAVAPARRRRDRGGAVRRRDRGRAGGRWRVRRRRGAACRHLARAAREAAPGQPPRRARDRRQLQLPQRRGRRGRRRQRGVRRAPRPAAPRPARRRRPVPGSRPR